jgi:hypothetical protein
MASADVKLSISPKQHALIVEALEAYHNQYTYIVEDLSHSGPTQAEKQEAARIVWGTHELLQQING